MQFLEATLKTRRFNSCYINGLKLESLSEKALKMIFQRRPYIKIKILKCYKKSKNVKKKVKKNLTYQHTGYKIIKKSDFTYRVVDL